MQPCVISLLAPAAYTHQHLLSARLPRPAEVSSKPQELLKEFERLKAKEGAAAHAFEADDWATGPSASAAATADGAPAAPAPYGGGCAPVACNVGEWRPRVGGPAVFVQECPCRCVRT